MFKLKVALLSGLTLSYSVAQILGKKPSIESQSNSCGKRTVVANGSAFQADSWQTAGPLIEREGICVRQLDSSTWEASHKSGVACEAQTPLVAAMRCFVKMRMGDEVELPFSLAEVYLSSVASEETILSVMLQDIVGGYDTPEEVPEWIWIQANASYGHKDNGQRDGIWEFVVNLHRDLPDIPARLNALITTAKRQRVSYILFHQGT